MSKVTKKTKSMVQEWEMVYKVVVQMVLLYKSEIWVVIESILKVLEGVSYQRVVEEGY